LKIKQTIGAIIIYFLTISASYAEDFVFSPINVLQGLSDNQIRYIIQLPDGRMVFKTSGNLNIYDGGQFKYIHQTSPEMYPLKGYDGFYRIYQRGALLWIKDYHKLTCVDLRKEKYNLSLQSYFNKRGFKKPIDDVFMDDKQRLWILASDKLSTDDHSISLNLSSDQGNLQDLSTDKNNLYLFYNTGEVVCYDLITTKKLNKYAAYPQTQQKFFKNTSLVVNRKDGFYQLRNGTKGGFFFFNIRNRSWKKILETNYPLNTLFVKPDGTAYISCANGIWIINCQTGEKRYLPTLKKVDGSILNTEVSTLFYDKQGGLWLGTLNQGLLYYHPSRYMFRNIDRSYFPRITARDIIVEGFAEDRKGSIYVKCQPETYRLDPSQKKYNMLSAGTTSSLPIEVLKKFRQDREIQRSGNYAAVMTDKRGWKWTGTQDGLRIFDPANKKEQLFYAGNGLSNNFIHAILQDRDNNMWITTSYGINRAQVNPLTGKITFSCFRSDTGTLDGEYTDGAAFEAVDGSLYFGGINGFSILKPNYVTSATLPFRPIFTNLLLRGEKIEAARQYDDRFIMSVAAPYTKNIELSFDQNFLTFEFSALNYKNPSQTYYRYQLEGIDRHWRETSGSQENESLSNDGLLRIYYTNLPYGKYRLMVMASSNNHEWDGEVTELQVTIHAPWWKTTVAYILFVALLLIVLFTGIYTYIYMNRKKMERLHKEDILLLRIRNLIDQQNFLQAQKEIYQQQLTIRDPNELANDGVPSQADVAFLARALEQVEKNLDVANYSVEQLSRDLFMDRTGLYRKLITLLDKSPSLFIRNVRLEKAAKLILEGTFNISEITEKVGFSTSSYLSKCFQEMYGCRPSEYAKKAKKST
jgi:AraC-like DNA-binding protein/ligand-binding sensor domain-containing protein